MITPMQMYWLLKLDNIRDSAALICIVSSAILILSVIFIPPFLTDHSLNEIVNHIKKPFLFLVGIALFGGLVNLFVPSTKQMATIVVVPALVNNQKVQEMGSKTLDISNDLLNLVQQYINEKLVSKEIE
ncbi:MAG: hypothetical protein NC222_07015 [Staphylococcus sp.]|nr:hypothetical protein [Staphylococcus sp.]